MNGRCESLPRAPRLLLFLCGQRSERQCFSLITTPHVRKAARQAARSASASSQAHALPLQLISLQMCNQRLSNFIFSDNLMGSKHVFTVQWAPVTQFLYLVIFFIQIFHFLSKVRCTSCLLAIRYPKYLFLSPPFIPAPTIFGLKGFRLKVSMLEKFFPVPSLQRKVAGDVNTPAGQVFCSCKHPEPRALDF